MKAVKFLVFAICIFLVSCGGEKVKENVEISVKPIDTNVSGTMDGCFEVINKEYKSSKDGANNIISVDIKRTNVNLPFALNGRELLPYTKSGKSAYVQVGFGIEFLDKNGNVLKRVSPDGTGLVGPCKPEDCVSLVKLEPGKQGTISFYVDKRVKDAESIRMSSKFTEKVASSYMPSSTSADEDNSSLTEDYSSTTITSNNSTASGYVVVTGVNLRLRKAPSLQADTYKWPDGSNKHPEKGQVLKCFGARDGFYNVEFEGNSLWISQDYAQPTSSGSGSSSSMSSNNTSSSYSTSASDYSSDSGSSGSSDVEELLDEYEKLVNSYVSLYKKFQNGDPTAAIEYAKVYKNINSYNSKIEKVKDEMSLSQVRRFNNITLKMTQIVQ